ncbi:hypothetical protein GCM10027425_19370 [Alteromonas gracilis]
MSAPTQLATAVLVDGEGRLLLQERDEHAPFGANQWGMVGGHVEPGEDPETAAWRELREETGLVPPYGALLPWRRIDLELPGRGAFEVHVHLGPTDATDADVVLGEGRRIVFVEPGEVEDLDLTASARAILPDLLASEDLARLSRLRRRSFASILLVDERGHLLLQERDEHPRIDPDRWGFVGGHVDPGEQIEHAAYRELAEETGVHLREGLRVLGRFTHHHEPTDELHTFTLFGARTALTDADIVVGEGRRIVFVDPAALPGLPLTTGAAQALVHLDPEDLL